MEIGFFFHYVYYLDFGGTEKKKPILYKKKYYGRFGVKFGSYRLVTAVSSGRVYRTGLRIF